MPYTLVLTCTHFFFNRAGDGEEVGGEGRGGGFEVGSGGWTKKIEKKSSSMRTPAYE